MKKFKTLSEPMKIAFIGAAGAIIAAVLGAIIGGIFLLRSTTTPVPAPTATTPITASTTLPKSITSTVTSTTQPTSSALYQADFSQGSQGWLNNSPSPQWTYNDTDKVLQSDGSSPCCNPISELENVVLDAPATIGRADYTIEARIKVIGNNPYDTSQPPFFGFFFRGYGLNGNGYMAGIIGSEPNHSNTGPLTFILVQEPGTLLTRDDKAPYDLDNQWHTYWLMARGNTYTFFIDQNQMYSQSLPQYFPPGPRIGIEDYDYNLQIQSLTVNPLCTPYVNCPGT